MLWFPGSFLPSLQKKRRQIASWHRLWLELGRYLIAFEPLTFVLDYENILGKCFRSSLSSNGPRISPLSFEYKCPRLSLLIIKSISENQQNRNDFLFYYSMHEYSGVKACFEHSNFFKVNLPASQDTRLRAP